MPNEQPISPALAETIPATVNAGGVFDLNDIELTDAVPRVFRVLRLAERHATGTPAASAAAADAEPCACSLAFDARESESTLYLIDLGRRRDRVQGGALANAYGARECTHSDGAPGDVSTADQQALDAVLEELRARGLLLACARRAAGGLVATVAEMMLAGNVGVALNIDLLLTGGDGVSDGRMDSGEVKNWIQQVSGRRAEQTLRALFSEEAGAVLQVRTADRAAAMAILRAHGLSRWTEFIGKTRPQSAATNQGKGELTIWRDAVQLFGARLEEMASADFGRRAKAPAGKKAAEPRKPETREEKIRKLRMGL